MLRTTYILLIIISFVSLSCDDQADPFIWIPDQNTAWVGPSITEIYKGGAVFRKQISPNIRNENWRIGPSDFIKIKGRKNGILTFDLTYTEWLTEIKVRIYRDGPNTLPVTELAEYTSPENNINISLRIPDDHTLYYNIKIEIYMMVYYPPSDPIIITLSNMKITAD